MEATNPDRVAMRNSAGERLAMLADSYVGFFGQPLVDAAADGLEQALWEAPRAILAHGTEHEPLFFYGNRLALALFEMDAQRFIGLPSYRSAEPAQREDRERMFEAMRLRGYVRDYTGLRTAASGKRFEIVNTEVWNLVDAHGGHHGQAATFAEWRLV